MKNDTHESKAAKSAATMLENKDIFTVAGEGILALRKCDIPFLWVAW